MYLLYNIGIRINVITHSCLLPVSHNALETLFPGRDKRTPVHMIEISLIFAILSKICEVVCAYSDLQCSNIVLYLLNLDKKN